MARLFSIALTNNKNDHDSYSRTFNSLFYLSSIIYRSDRLYSLTTTNQYIMTIKPNRTHCYRFTVEMDNEEDMKSLDTFRKSFYGTNCYVKCQGRWGKNNPNYKRSHNFLGHSRSFCPVSLAKYCDVYVYFR